MVGFNFPPYPGWALCDGQLLPISTNTALFSLLGTQFGGDGQTTFALPDLRGRVPIHQGQGSGLSTYSMGENGGSESTTLSVANLPAHSHGIKVCDVAGNAKVGGGNPPRALASLSNGDMYSTSQPGFNLNAASISNTGTSQPFSTQQPFLCVNFIIALVGIFPARS